MQSEAEKQRGEKHQRWLVWVFLFVLVPLVFVLILLVILVLSGLIQVSPQNMSFLKSIDLPHFPFRGTVLIHLKSVFAARFKLCKLNFV